MLVFDKGEKKMKRFFMSMVLVLVIVSTAFAQVANIQSGGQLKVMGVKEAVSTNPYVKPDESMRFIAFDIIIDNSKGKNDVQLNIFMGTFEIRDLEGFSYKPELLYGGMIASPAMDMNSTIEKGDLMRGWVSVAIPKNTPIDGLRIRLKTMNEQSDWITIKK